MPNQDGGMDWEFEDAGREGTVIGRYRTQRQAHEAGLAVLAAGHPYWVFQVEGEFVLTVASAQADRLRKEVEFADRLNRFWPPPSLELPTHATRKTPTVIAAISLVGIFLGQSSNDRLEDVGMNSSQAVLVDGEWWRLVTAITLHADVAHLAGNLFGIAIFAYLCCRYMGNGLAWALIVLVAALSNLTSAFAHAGDAYFSLGASTAVFAALGLLTGFPVGSYLRTREKIASRDWLIPFFGGCILFAWMGGGEFPTDVAAHFWSFLYGLVIATLVSWSAAHAKLTGGHQKALLAAIVALIGASWGVALR